MGLNIDAEEADRLSLSLDVIETVLAEPALKGWEGFGVVVQAFGQRAAPVLDWLYALAERLDRRIMVRLVKGAYWDTEIKRAQVAGVAGFPVFTSKAATDISYLANARKLLAMTDRIYPQFATHNAHTVAAILDMAEDKSVFEFQRLHGMGEALHDIVLQDQKTRCRIYAPVGAHRDLLAYLVRRLLENGANSSFVNQIVDEDVSPEQVARDPFETVQGTSPSIATGPRSVHAGTPEFPWLRFDPSTDARRHRSGQGSLCHTPLQAEPLLADRAAPLPAATVLNPANNQDSPGQVSWSSAEDAETALSCAATWSVSPSERCSALNRAANLYEENFGELFALLAREAGKTLPDAVAELREAVDFLRYYAQNAPAKPAVGIFTCISPWNFPLAIFTGQISAALAAGNAVLAKPAEQTPLIAFRAIQLMHEAGVPRSALQLLPGAGDMGAILTSDPRVGGVAFTGSTETARRIRSAMAENLKPGAPLIAETGGLNAMIVDSTALPEQAIQAIIESAFQSAGQRCSALRCLYVQEDIAQHFTKMLTGAMQELRLGDPWHLSTDCGPVIDAGAQADIAAYVDTARAEGRVLMELNIPDDGTFIAPVLIGVKGIHQMEREIFGPVLHLATFRSEELDDVIDAINATGYGLTFGLQTRIDDRVQHVSDRIHAGNVYVNRNQIGAIVGSQPFGGEGLSGTGPKAGGPYYLNRFVSRQSPVNGTSWKNDAGTTDIADALARAKSGSVHQTVNLPGPTGESNLLTTFARPPVLCAGPGQQAAEQQVSAIEAMGGVAVATGGQVAAEALTGLSGKSGVIWWGDAETARAYERALSKRAGPIIPLITEQPDPARALAERHVCVDTTASGGNAALLGGDA